MNKWLSFAVTVAVMFLVGAAIIALGNGLSAVAAPAIWRAKGEYEIMAANADAVRAQTAMLKTALLAGLSFIGLLLLTVSIAFLTTMFREWRLTTILSSVEQKYLEQGQVACLPKDTYMSLPAPKRENTYTEV